MPYKGGVQLLPETRQQVMRRAVAGNAWIYWGVGIATVVLIVNIILSSYMQNLTERIAEQDGILRTQEESRDKEIERELQAVSKQSKLMGSLLESHVYWSQAFDLLGVLMQSGVRFTSVTADAADGSIEYSAMASSYATVARQIASFNSGDGILDIEVTGVKSSGGAVEFNGTISIDPAKVLTKTE